MKVTGNLIYILALFLCLLITGNLYALNPVQNRMPTGMPKYFIAVYNEPFQQGNSADSLAESYEALVAMVQKADSYNIRLTLVFAPQWVDYLREDAERWKQFQSWRLKGHEIAAQHHGVFKKGHAGWDGYSGFSKEEAERYCLETNGITGEPYLGNLKDFIEKMRLLVPELCVGCIDSGSTDPDFIAREYPAGIKYDICMQAQNFNTTGNTIRSHKDPYKGVNQYISNAIFNNELRHGLSHYFIVTHDKRVEAQEVINQMTDREIYGAATHSFPLRKDVFFQFLDFLHSKDPKGQKSCTVSEIFEKRLLPDESTFDYPPSFRPSPVGDNQHPVDIRQPLPIYVTIVSHNEDNPKYVVYDTRQGYVEMRQAAIDMVNTFTSRGAAFHFQPDWRFLKAAQQYESGDLLNSTNHKNILRYLKEDLGAEINPHSHEHGGYNYADVAKMIKDFGVEPGNIVGGFLAFNNELNLPIDWEKFRTPLGGNKNTYTWNPDILWGASAAGHQQDNNVCTCGIHRPKSVSEFLVNDPHGRLINIGTCGSSLESLRQLIKDLQTGKAPMDNMYTWSMLVFEFEVWASKGQKLDEYRQAMETLKQYEQNGWITFASLNMVVQKWTEMYHEKPNLYKVVVEESPYQQQPPNDRSNRMDRGQGRGERGDRGDRRPRGSERHQKCGDGECDEFEQAHPERCPEDCSAQ